MARRLRGDTGTSLAELLVSMVLIGIIGTITSTALISGQRAASSTTSRVQATGDVKVAHRAVVKALRNATTTTIGPAAVTAAVSPSRLVSADARKVVFYAHDGAATGPTLTTYEAMADGRLVETRVPATAVAATGSTAAYYTWTGTGVSRVLLRDVAAGTVFKYYDVTSTAPNGVELALSGAPLALTATQLPLVDAVEVGLTVSRLSSGKPQALTVTNRVGIRRNQSPVKA